MLFRRYSRAAFTTIPFRRFRLAACLITLGCAAAVARAESPSAESLQWWGQWRGPTADGLAPQGKPPLTWSEASNVRWKVELPGHGLSTPIVWADRIYLLAAVPAEQRTASAVVAAAVVDAGADGQAPSDAPSANRPESGARRGEGELGSRGPRGGGRRDAPTDPYRFTVLALDRATGKTVWERVVRQQVPHEGTHQDGSLAPASPITDGKHIWAYFGSRGLYCIDLDGNVVWEKDLGDMRTRNGFGEGSSPALVDDLILVIWDHEGDSFIVALDAATGEERWRRPRDEPTSWATPHILRDGQRTIAVVPGSNRVRAYDLATGDVVWECAGLGTNCIPTPVAGAGGLVFTMSGHREPALLAIRYPGATGDLTGSSAVAWSLAGEGTPYVPSPLLYGDTLYFIQKNTGILSAYDAESGSQRFKERLAAVSGVYASLVGADERVYVVGRNGTTVVLKRGPAFDVLAVNKLDDAFDASPAIVGDELYLRGLKHLYCIKAQ